VRSLVGLSRWREWAHSKLPFVAATALLLDVTPERALLILSSLVPWAAFGYALNALVDRAQDARAGKPVPAVGTGQAGCFLAVAGTAALLSSLLWSNGAIVAAGLVVAVAYSAPPLRLKERGAVGVLTGAAAQWMLPVLAVAIAAPDGVPVAQPVALVALALVVGVRWMLVHQRQDADADRRASVRTFGAASDRLADLLVRCFALEVALLACVLAAGGARTAPAAAALLPSLAWPRTRSMRERLQGYVDAPLSAYYFCLLPLAAGLVELSPASAGLGLATAVIGAPALIGAVRTSLPRPRPVPART
jgi:4-hydroxybenzoate polyprenyltransferase